MQIIGIILERTLGKVETHVKVTDTRENIENADQRLMAIICELQEEEERRALEAAQSQMDSQEEQPEEEASGGEKPGLEKK